VGLISTTCITQERSPAPKLATTSSRIASANRITHRRQSFSEEVWFAAKLRTELAAVQAGLTLRHSNGQTEGHVTKLKPVKRQGYGRAKVDLLRKRLLQAA
jgi:transposase